MGKNKPFEVNLSFFLKQKQPMNWGCFASKFEARNDKLRHYFFIKVLVSKKHAIKIKHNCSPPRRQGAKKDVF
jgi:hypothetical protein